MKRTPFSLDFSPVDPKNLGLRQDSPARRIAVIPYDEVMAFFLANHGLPQTDPKKHANIDVAGYTVAINGMKLRTFAQAHAQHMGCCADPTCGLRPAYFAVERVDAKPTKTPMTVPNRHRLYHQRNERTAYLSLYGVDADGKEVEFTHDHTLARCFGGANTLANTTMMCQPCNNRKSRIESRIHQRTLRMLKDYLEDSTGLRADPQFLLERVRQADLNLDMPERVLERVGIVSVGDAVAAIRNEMQHNTLWHDKNVKVSGVRLQAFAHQEQPCCQNPTCGLQATHFAVERLAGLDDRFGAERGYHLNMYGQDAQGQDIPFAHHHVLQHSADGVPQALAVVTLCQPCKDNVLRSDDQNMAHILSSLGGTTRQDLKVHSEKTLRPNCFQTTYATSETPPNKNVVETPLANTVFTTVMAQEHDERPHSKMERRIAKSLAICSLVQTHVQLTDTDAFHQHCNRQGICALTNVVEGRVQTLMEAVPALTRDGAAWVLHQYNTTLARTHKKQIAAAVDSLADVSHKKRAELSLAPARKGLSSSKKCLKILDDCAKNNDIFHKASIPGRERKITRYWYALAEYHRMTPEEFAHHCTNTSGGRLPAPVGTVDDTALREIARVLKVELGAACVFVAECGRVLGVGPLRDCAQEENRAHALILRLEELRAARRSPHIQSEMDRVRALLYAQAPPKPKQSSGPVTA